jgi:hypothetical protein
VGSVTHKEERKGRKRREERKGDRRAKAGGKREDQGQKEEEFHQGKPVIHQIFYFPDRLTYLVRCFTVCQIFYSSLPDVFFFKQSGTRFQILCQMFENHRRPNQTFEFSKHLVHQDKTSDKNLDIGKHTRMS